MNKTDKTTPPVSLAAGRYIASRVLDYVDEGLCSSEVERAADKWLHGDRSGWPVLYRWAMRELPHIPGL